jgi:hypothetical protein
MLRCSVVSVALVFAACGGGDDLCQKWADKLEACEDDDYDVEQCEEEVASCDSDDLKLLDEFYQCADDAGLFACDTEQTTASLTEALQNIGEIFACVEPLEGLSEDCQGDVMSTGTTSLVF